MIAIKRSGDIGATGVTGIIRIREPDAEMSHGNCSIAQNKALLAEDPREVADAVPFAVCFDVTLVPTQTEGPGIVLHNKKREFVIWCKTGHFNVHVLHRSQI